MKNKFHLKKNIPIILFFFCFTCINLLDFLSFFFLLLLFSSVFSSLTFFFIFDFSSISSSFLVAFFDSISISSSLSSSSSLSNLNLFLISSKLFKYPSKLGELKLISFSKKKISLEYILYTIYINPIISAANNTALQMRAIGTNVKFSFIFFSFSLSLNELISE